MSATADDIEVRSRQLRACLAMLFEMPTIV